MTPYKDFTVRLQLLIRKNPQLITTTLSNIFTMRLVGNKTHGDLAEIAIAEFINQYMYDFRSIHVGKDLFRAKSHEEDITIINEITKAEFPVSLKAYGNEFLQLSTDKHSLMFPRLMREEGDIQGKEKLDAVFSDPAFSAFSDVNVLPLIYNEKNKKCNILVFDYETARSQTARIVYINPAKRRKHPVFRFYDAAGDYICEVRYGDATANGLQRGLWTHTKNALKHFESITDGWISYENSPILVSLLSHALLSTPEGQTKALDSLKADIEAQKKTVTP